MYRLCSGYSMDVIAGAAFGVQVDSLENPDDAFTRHGVDVVNKNAWVFNVGACSVKFACWSWNDTAK